MSSASSAPPNKSRLAALTVAAIGVVYGDIGTSPLYALKECFSPHYGLQRSMVEVFGILSLIFWSLAIVVSLKYLLVILRYDNKGEGGILSLMELVSPLIKRPAAKWAALALGLFGAALLYGDGAITPAISVLSAVEGITVTAPALTRAVIPITVVILLILFMVQRHGTGRVGGIFGPFMLFWFALMAFLGVVSIVQSPEVLMALNPWYAFEFFMHHGLTGAVVLGSIVLVVTGAETLYADMGHFGRKSIKVGWFYIVFPSLLLNYFGQGALLLREGHIPSTVERPFYHLVPEWGVIPLVIVSTAAAIIASQAVISGAYSLTWQALQLGYLPRLKVTHTSSEERGQIYVPFINWALFVATVFLVLEFRSSSNLAAMYGIAICTTMVITTLLSWNAIRHISKMSVFVSVILISTFFIMDMSFFTANIFKFADGGWFPLVLATVIYILILTWRKGRVLLRQAIERRTEPLHEIIEDIDEYEMVPGTALYMSGYAGVAPPSLVNNIKYNRVRHENIIILTIQVSTQARVSENDRFSILPLPKNFYQVILHYGFMDQFDLMKDLHYLPEFDIPVDITDVTFILGDETVSVGNKGGMAAWRKHLFAFLHRNSRTPAKHFGVPFKRVLEVGSTVEI